MNESEIIYTLEELMTTNSEVIICDGNLQNLICNRVAKRELLNIKILYGCDEEHRLSEYYILKNYSLLKPIKSEDLKWILDFYRLYDFSDKVTVIAESAQYGSLYNYVKTGLLTEEELMEALEYENNLVQ